MPTNEEQYQQPFDQDRAGQQDKDRQEEAGQRPIQPTTSGSGKTVSFPWAIFCLAALFDIVGCVFLLNFITEIIAGFIFGLWQKKYNQKTDPIITFIIAKIIDAAFLGFLPSNIGIVVYAYIKKKAATKIESLANTKIGSMAINRAFK